MKAILFDETTLPLIIRKMKIDLTAGEYREMKQQRSDKRYYFFPEYTTADGVPLNTWVLLEEEYVQKNFSYDHHRINIQFVEMTRI